MAHHDTHAHPATAKTLLYSIFINIAISLVQFIGGLISGSLSLLTDALHNFSDVVSLVISYAANRLVKKEADFSKTFGYKRAEIIAAFINAATLVVLAVFLMKEAVLRFFQPAQVINSNIVIWLALLAIIGNGVCALLLYKDSSNNMNIRSSYYHLLTDMYTSIAVLIGGLLMKYYHLFWIDSLLGLLIGIYLIYIGFDLLKSSLKVLMLFSPKEISMQKLVERVNSVQGVKSLHHVHVWLLNEQEVHLEAHLDMEENITLSEFNEVVDKIEKLVFNEFGINHCNLQPEFQKQDPKDIIVQD